MGSRRSGGEIKHFSGMMRELMRELWRIAVALMQKKMK